MLLVFLAQTQTQTEIVAMAVSYRIQTTSGVSGAAAIRPGAHLKPIVNATGQLIGPIDAWEMDEVDSVDEVDKEG